MTLASFNAAPEQEAQAEMLAALRQRLANDEASERLVATAELRKITVLRVGKALTA